MGKTATVLKVTDGDTIDVRFDDGTEETVRIIGIDTPETTDNVEAERRVEWEGIEDLDYLGRWGDRASTFAKGELEDKKIELEADSNEPDRGSYGRLLRYVRYDQDGTGGRDTVYNREAVKTGYARVYDSGFTRHDSYLTVEAAARQSNKHVWTKSNPTATSEIRDHAVETLFFPKTASVCTDGGPVEAARTVVTAQAEATQQLQSGTEYTDRIPLAAVDESARTAVLGGPLLDEAYEQAEGFSGDTSSYGNFSFVTNLLSSLSDRSGPVNIDGGHGQFNADYALSAEDMAYYLRYLEGQDLLLRQVNSMTDTDSLTGQTLLVTAPSEPFSAPELAAVSSFRDAGGSILLIGHSSTDMPESARSNLNEIAAELGTDLRLNGDSITDDSHNLDGDKTLLTTTSFDSSSKLFAPYSPKSQPDGSIAISRVDSTNESGEPSTDERVILKNRSAAPLDLSGWQIQDAAGHTYEFPEGLTIPADMQVVLWTGDGDDQTTLYWNRSQAVWNNDGDTVSVYDETGSLVSEQSY